MFGDMVNKGNNKIHLPRVHVMQCIAVWLSLFLVFTDLYPQSSNCGQTVYDCGGVDAPYDNNEHRFVTYCADLGQTLKITFTAFQLEEQFDYLNIFDGESVMAPLIGHYTGIDSPGIVLSTGQCITFEFFSDDNNQANGYIADISCISPCDLKIVDVTSTNVSCNMNDGSLTILTQSTLGKQVLYSIDGGQNFYSNASFYNLSPKTYQIAVKFDDGSCEVFSTAVLFSGCLEICANGIDDNQNGIIDEYPCQSIEYLCDGNFYDDGGANGHYTFDTTYVNTYCAENGGQIQLEMSAFELDLGLTPDTLIVYDGNNVQAPLIGKYFGRSIVTGEEFRIRSSFQSTNGCLTFEFKSGQFGVRSGWAGTFSCTPARNNLPEICGNGIDDDQDGFIDDQDIDCSTVSDEIYSCTPTYIYYIPPVYNMGGNPLAYSNPGVLSLITTAGEAQVNIMNADSSFTRQLTIVPNQGDTLHFEGQILQTNVFNKVEQNKGLIIESTKPLQLSYMLNGYINRNFVTIKGQSALGKSFVAGSQTNTLVHSFEGKERKEHHFVSVMASENQTTVQFAFTRSMKNISSPHQITLDKGETYLIVDNDLNTTVTGLKITSDKPITAISGSQHTNAYQVTDQDGGADMLIPLSKLGTSHVCVRGGVVQVQDYAIVTAVNQNTRISVNGSQLDDVLLHAGEFIEIPISGSQGTPTFIEGNQPIAVFHVTGQSSAEVGLAAVPAIGACRGDTKLNFARNNMTDVITLQLLSPISGLSSLQLNGTSVESLASAIFEDVPGLNTHKSIVIQNSDIQSFNTITATEKIMANVLIGDATNACSYGAIGSIDERIIILNPETGEPEQQYNLPLICANESFDHTLVIESCSPVNKILSAQVGHTGIVELMGDLDFRYTNNGKTGTDVLTLEVANGAGVKTQVCLQVIIDSLGTFVHQPEAQVCAFDTTILKIDSIAGTAPYTYQWSTGEKTPSISVSPDADSIYFVTVTDQKGCNATEQFKVNVLPTIRSEAGYDVAVCHEEIVQLGASNPLNSTGSWYGGAGTFANIYDPNSKYTPSASEVGTSFYLYWKLSSSNGGACYIELDSVLVTITDDLEVYAGQDAYVCDSDPFELASLNAQLNSTSISDGLWKTNGDGYFTPGSENVGSFNESTHYVPGNQDEANGEVTLQLEVSDPNGVAPCNFDADDVTIFIQNIPALVCNDHLQIALNGNCSLTLTPDILLEGAVPPFDKYEVVLKDQNNQVIPNATVHSGHVGGTIDFTVTYNCNLNNCSGSLTILDQQIPSLECSLDTIACTDGFSPEEIGFPLPSTATIYPMNTYYMVEGFDGCSNVTLSYTDNIVPQDCSTGFQSIIERTWYAVDEAKNKTECTQLIYVELIPLSKVVLPKNFDDKDTFSIDCSYDYPKNINGYPDISFTGVPQFDGCQKMEYTYSDVRLDLCGTGYKIVRDWRVFDWCNSTSIDFYQIIMVVDKSQPIMVCNATSIINTSQYTCASGLVLLENPTVYDDCSEVEISASILLPNGETVYPTNNNGNLLISDLPLGSNIVSFVATDACGNKDTCEQILEVKDLIVPTMVCEGTTKVALSNTGVTRLYATSINDGIYDNCEIASIEIRKMTDSCGYGYEFGPFVEYCCNEIGLSNQVVVKATDIFGNENFCMAEVLLEDKLAPYIKAPSDLTISCKTFYSLDTLSAYFGKIALDQSLQKDIVIYDDVNNGVVGTDGIAIDNCTLEITDTFNLTEHCGEGLLTRTFIATDGYGQQSTDIQYIHIVNTDSITASDIIWPSNVDTLGCKDILSDPTYTGVPYIENVRCSQVSVSHEDKAFNTADSSCVWILRTWSVLDVCQFNSETGTGLWEKIQTIKLHNVEAPVFYKHVSDTTVCTYGACNDEIEFSTWAHDDCTTDEALVYSYFFDHGDDGTMDFEGIGNRFTIPVENGTHRIYWRVQDQCGNWTTNSYKVEAVDCKNPTPYCIKDLSTALMDQVGYVQLKPKDFNLSSSDNCTPQGELLFSFSKDTTDQKRVITCDDLEDGISKVFTFEMWVTDQAGNQDYCTVQVLVEDNVNICPNEGTIALQGVINTFKGAPLSDVSITLSGDSNNNQTTNTDDDGRFSVEVNGNPQQVTITPYSNNDFMKGVSALDIALIQKHILGIKPFNDSYKFIAADVNKSNTVTGSDIIIIRKAILGHFTKGFPKNTSWRFINMEEGFNPTNVFDFVENYTYNAINKSRLNEDFLAIKIGDVNGSAKVGISDHNAEARGEDNMELMVKQLDDNTIAISFAEDQVVQAAQFELDWSRISVPSVDLISGKWRLNATNSRIIDGSACRIVWNAMEAMTIKSTDVLFKLKFDAQVDMETLMQVLEMSDDITAMCVNDDLVVFSTTLTQSSESESTFKVYQNIPNPFRSFTTVQFDNPQTQWIKYTLVSNTGDVIFSKNEFIEQGTHIIEISDQLIQQAGVYHLNFIVDRELFSRKLIKIQ